MATDAINNARMIPDIDIFIDKALDEIEHAKDFISKYYDVFGDIEED